MKVLWCHYHLVGLVFEGSIPTCACFCPETNFFVTCFLLLFYGKKKRREVGGEAKGKMHGL